MQNPSCVKRGRLTFDLVANVLFRVQGAIYISGGSNVTIDGETAFTENSVARGGGGEPQQKCSSEALLEGQVVQAACVFRIPRE